MLHITRANSNGICFCDCEDSLLGIPSQLDCPWCGCGWLMCCDKCGKAFMFGKAVEVEGDLRKMIRADLLRREWPESALDDETLDSAVEHMQQLMEGIEEGHEYVYFDGFLIPTDDEGPFEIEGTFARHELDSLPHLAAIDSPLSLETSIGDPEYWQSRKIEDEGEDDEE